MVQASQFKISESLSPAVSEKVKTLRTEFFKVYTLYEECIPRGLPRSALKDVHYRIFNFPPKEDNYEFFEIVKGSPYVCLDAHLLKRDFYRAFQYFCHGVTHSISFFEPSFFKYDFAVEEMFCEVMGYKALAKMLRRNRAKEAIIRKALHNSPSAYTRLAEIGFKLEKQEHGFLAKINERLYQAKLLPFKKRQQVDKKIDADFVQRCERIGVTEKQLIKIGKSLKSDKILDLEKGFIHF